MNKLLKFFLLGLIISVVLFGVSFLVYDLQVNKGEIPFTALVFVLINLFVFSLSHAVLLNASKLEPKQFVRYFMASTGIKMFVSAAIIAGYVMLGKQYVKINAIFYAVYYLVFLFMETIMIYNILRKKDEK